MEYRITSVESPKKYDKVIQVYADSSEYAKLKSKTQRLVLGLNQHPDYAVRLTTTVDPSHIEGADAVVNALSPELDSHRNGHPFVTHGEFEGTRMFEISSLVDRVHDELAKLGDAA
jgi:hypothetical protein